MPTHLEQMTERLPHLYREGELLQGLLALAATQMEIAEEEARAVQRSHWFDATLNLGEATRLAMPLDIAREEWQSNLREYRAWVHAIRDSLLRHGSVTVDALQRFVVQYSSAFQAAVDIRVLPQSLVWGDNTAENELVFEENPPRRLLHTLSGVEPLQRFSITQNGLFETPAAFLLTGLPSAPESVPVVANFTTGQALVFLGSVPPGQRLWLRPREDGTAQGLLEDEDVTDRLRSITDLQPGTAWTAAGAPAQAMTLARGVNEMWFLPVAHYDALGLDRFLLALADLLMTQGRWDESRFDQALFYQDAALRLGMTWLESQPATFEVRLPGGILLNEAGRLEESLAERERLGLSLNVAIDRLRAAGVQADVVLEPRGAGPGGHLSDGARTPGV
jgi:hypothetical protein